MSDERLQKILARAGVASRRHAEEMILAGRVRVDGRVITELGVRADPFRDRIEVDGKKIVPEPPAYIVLHKPRGVVSTLRDPEGRPTVAELVRDVAVRVVPIGRLDYHTSGVLLLTNDGEFASVLSHPRSGVAKKYVAKVSGIADDRGLERLRQSIVIEGRPTQPAAVKRLRTEGGKTWVEITLKEGRNRQVRRMGESSGFPVMRLARVEFAGVTGEGLRPGQWRHLTPEELAEIKGLHGVPKRVRAGAKTRAATEAARASSRGRPRAASERSPRPTGRGRPRASTAR
jgi:23S rRNA pseudouridine2605 synthase